ncbi:P-loop containing nucleoside triphosphate hydrolase protein [Podospora conica]|nr:P-loop containing nucleoside triphosphate hydrolase protein [Schizothecium conicum]
MVAFDSNSMSKLCSADQLKLLNAIDSLRLQGINSYVSLPQIIVCGDQSSGKSSVLEGLSGVPFPVKSNLCTRFPTELVLRRSQDVGATVSIVPHSSRSESERKALSGFQKSIIDFEDLPGIIDDAKLAMGISPHGKAFSQDILRIEISGPDRPHLTIVDLPGLIHTETKYQTASDVRLIKEVVQGYMKESRCIILAVVSAKNDFANQIVLKLARIADKAGSRTLGVITKPDTLKEGSGNETMYVDLARNQEIEFRLGWHVLKNMDSDAGPCSLKERDEQEAKFFNKGAWTELPRSSLGIDRLRGRLSKVLLQQIARELPSLIEEIDRKFKACDIRLLKLGMPRSEVQSQRRYLFELSHSFQTLIKSSVDGTYSGSFFGDANEPQGYQKRIRAFVQNTNESFASDLSIRGRYRKITDEPDDELDKAPVDGSDNEADSSTMGASNIPITRDELLEHINNLIRKTRGRELPGTFNPMIVNDLFIEQSRPWEAIAKAHIRMVWLAAQRFIDLVIGYVADGSTAKTLQKEVFGPAMAAIFKNMECKTAELLTSLRDIHPITYNHYFTETVQNLRHERMKKEMSKTVQKFFGLPTDPSLLAPSHRLTKVDWPFKQLVDSLANCNEPNMNEFAAQEALNCLLAYYKVALKRFIDDISVEVIEAQLVSKISDILSAVSICDMSDETISRLAGESEESRAEREQLNRQLCVLKSGLETCKRFASVRVSGDSLFASSQDNDLDPNDDDSSREEDDDTTPRDKSEADPEEEGFSTDSRE